MVATTTSTRELRAPRRYGWARWVLWAVLALVVVLLAARLYLPTYLKDYVNEKLNAMPGYRGSVADIDVALIRGAYLIKGLEMYKIDKGIPVPFVKIAVGDISLQWGALFKGEIVSDIHLTRPEINFAVSKSGATSQTGTETNWNPLIDQLVPIDINLVEITNGKVTYQDFSAAPAINIYIHNLDGQVTNLRNVDDKSAALPSNLKIYGTSLGDGKLNINGRLNTLTPNYPDMDIDTKLEGAKLVAFNDFTRNCCALDFKKGRIDLYSELVIKKGQISGYLKPLVHDLSVDRIPQDSNPLEVAWASIASVLLEVFENQPNDQFATKVPLSGSLDKGVQTSIWPTIGGIFRNAFVEAFKKGTDNEVNFEKPKQE
jgi:hypothetical protein